MIPTIAPPLPSVVTFLAVASVCIVDNFSDYMHALPITYRDIKPSQTFCTDIQSEYIFGQGYFSAT